MKNLIFWTTMVFLFCCKPTDDNLVKYNGGRQLLNLNGFSRTGEKLKPFEIDNVTSDSIISGQEFLTKVFMADQRIELIAAYFDCKEIDNATVDTVVNSTNNYQRLDGCTNGLIVQNDTIYIIHDRWTTW